MKNYFLLLLIPIISLSQNKNEAENKVNEGVSLHDQGKYNDALAKYDEALNLDKNNLLALSEKAMTLNASKNYSEAINVSILAIKSHPNEDVKNVYVSYANSLDHLNQIDKALKIYDEGLNKYPKYYQLHFNKGITLVNAKEVDKAITAFQNAIKLNPNHTSSYNALAVLNQQNRIPSILASSRYLILDNKSARAKGNLDSILTLMAQGVSQKEDNSISLNINSELLDNVNNKKSTDNFSSTDLVLSMTAALDYDDKNKDKTQCQKFIDKFESICRSMNEIKKGQNGFYWEFLAPYFIEMENKKLIEPFAFIIFLPTQNSEVIKYHQENAEKIKEFYDWSKNYSWN